MSEQARLLASYQKIQQKVSAFSNARLVAVSKFQSIEKIKVLVEAGHRDFGENYVQEWEAKMSHFSIPLRWHFIGQLQSRKLKDLVEKNIYAIHSIGSMSAFERLLKLKSIPEGGCFLQINLAGEAQKGGLSMQEVESLLEKIPPNGVIRGLMTIPPVDYRDTTLRKHFKEVKRLNDQWGFKELSMGMSDDWEMALEEGSTTIRVGSALFGSRPT